MTKNQEQKIKEKQKKEARIAIAITLGISAVLIILGLVFIVIIPLVDKSKATSFDKVGNIVSFGSYEQDNDTDNGTEAIKWKVIAVEDGKALLLSQDILDGRSYEDSSDYVTWETSDLREWMNSEFYDDAFSKDEKSHIQTTTLSNEEGTPFTVSDTEDQVFILSASELFKYFDTASEIAALPSTFAGMQRQVPATTTYGYFWLRTAASIDSFDKGDDGQATNIVYNEENNNEDGSTYALYFANGLQYKGYEATTVLGVRPAIWVDIE